MDLGTAHLTPGPHPVREGIVSVVLVNYKGAADTIVCLKALDELQWPADRLELIVVDNDSGDGQAEQIAQACPKAQVIRSGANLGFAGGCNLGVDNATGQYVAFLNRSSVGDRFGRPTATFLRWYDPPRQGTSLRPRSISERAAPRCWPDE